MKVNIKEFKKISLAYILQIFAVILLFFFVGSSSANKANEPAANVGLPLLINRNNFLNSYKDSLLTGKAIFLSHPHTEKTGNKK